MGRGNSGLSGTSIASGGGGSNVDNDSYTRGKTTYSVEVAGNGKDYYLVMQTGQTKTKDKISFAKDDKKARVFIKGLKTYLYLNEDPNILAMLKSKRTKRTKQTTNRE